MITSKSLYLTLIATALVTFLTIVTIDVGSTNRSTNQSNYSYLKVSHLRSLVKNIISSPSPCGINEIVILIHSSINHEENRDILRRFIPGSYKKVFVVGHSLNDTENSEIRNESRKNGDLLVGGFIDSYQNLTVKHLTGYEFVHRHCRRASMVIKIDDDIFVNFQKLAKYLQEEFPPPKSDPINITDRIGYNMYRCFVIHKALVVRSESKIYQKWAVPKSIYKDLFYPDYCSGWAYITTVGAIDIILDKVKSESQAFWIDDVYITGILKDKWSISLEPMNEYFCHELDKLQNWLQSFHPWKYIFSNTDSNVNLLRSLYKHAQETMESRDGIQTVESGLSTEKMEEGRRRKKTEEERRKKKTEEIGHGKVSEIALK